MQLFGARANLAKCLLYAINGGRDEKYTTKDGRPMQVGPAYAPITSEYLDYQEVMHKYDQMLDWLAGIYVNILNLIHYMHDKYYYESAEMALIDTDVRRTFATGIAGFSHVVDSLSAIRYAKVKVIRDEYGIARKFETEGDFPRYGNDDDRADEIAVWLLKTFLHKVKKIPHLPEFRGNHLDPHDHLQCCIWQGNRRTSGRTAGIHPVCPGRNSFLRRRAERSARFFKLGRKASI